MRWRITDAPFSVLVHSYHTDATVSWVCHGRSCLRVACGKRLEERGRRQSNGRDAMAKAMLTTSVGPRTCVVLRPDDTLGRWEPRPLALLPVWPLPPLRGLSLQLAPRHLAFRVERHEPATRRTGKRSGTRSSSNEASSSYACSSGCGKLEPPLSELEPPLHVYNSQFNEF